MPTHNGANISGNFSNAPGRLKPGDRVSEFVLDEHIGGGAFGEVWRARHHVWVDQVVAIKFPTDSAYVRALQTEGSCVHGLHHANIVRPLGMDPFAAVPYLVMEYVPGSDLRHLIRQGKLEPDQATAILRQVLDALAYAHGQNVVHRDVKPENILLHERGLEDGFSQPGVVKLTDFGLGRTVDAGGAAAQSVAFSIDAAAGPEASAARRLAGTLDYMAPEVRAGEAATTRADLYACGVILYEMLTGEKPAGTDVPSDLNPAVPKWLDEVFRRSYARLEKRYESAEQMRDALVAPAAPPPLPQANGSERYAQQAAVASPSAHSCPECHGRTAPGDQFCISCGHQLVAQVRRCGRCGAFPDPADHFCIFCGNELAGARETV